MRGDPYAATPPPHTAALRAAYCALDSFRAWGLANSAGRGRPAQHPNPDTLGADVCLAFISDNSAGAQPHRRWPKPPASPPAATSDGAHNDHPDQPRRRHLGRHRR